MSAPDLRAYLVWLRADYKPRRLTGGDDPLSPKTLRNIWVSLAAFFAWFGRELEVPNPMKSVPTPKFEEKPVEPFTKEDIEQVLKACDYYVEAHPENRAPQAASRSPGCHAKGARITWIRGKVPIWRCPAA